MLAQILDWFTLHIIPLVRVVALTMLGLWVGWFLSRLAHRQLREKVGAQAALLISKSIRYTLFVLVVFSVLRQLGFDLGAFLGAAGIAGVAIGFASQTSLSNLVSGIFLIFESPFKIGEVVEIDGITGTVDNIALLSTFIRTFDNRLVRIPNETVIKTRVINITRFPVRRLDLPVGVAYKHDAGRVIDILKEVAFANTLCLDEPEPLVIFNGFGASSLDFTICVWIEKTNVLATRNALLTDIKRRFDAEGIEIPFPHLSLYAGSESAPLPIRLVADPAEPASDVPVTPKGTV